MSSSLSTSIDPLSGEYSFTDTLKGVYYGPGCMRSALPKLLDILNAKRALVVTGKTLHHKTDVVRRVEDVLKEHNAYGGTFSDIGEHAPISSIRAGVKAFNDAQADIIVAIGGGSPIDASKAILYFLHEEGFPYRRQIAIPTTLSAAEYTVCAGYTDEGGKKAAVFSFEMAPAGVILDAELTLATPPRLWLSTGIRALDHSVEWLYRPGVPHPNKALCYSALADLFKYLPLSKAEPANVEHRQWLQIASWMSLWPLRFEGYGVVGLSHALGHKLGATYGIPHGITSCITLPPVVNLQADIAPPVVKQYLGKCIFYLGEPSTGSLEGDIKKLSTLIRQLVIDLGLETKLSEYDVPREDFPQVVEQVLGTKEDPAFDKVVRLLEGLP